MTGFYKYLLPLCPFRQFKGVNPLHGLLLDLRYGEFRLLVVNEVNGEADDEDIGTIVASDVVMGNIAGVDVGGICIALGINGE